MATAAVLAPRDVHTTLNYSHANSDEKPYTYVYQPPDGKPRTNLVPEPHPAVVHDVRGHEDTVSLDENGFAFVKEPASETEFVDEERIKTVYYKEVEELLKKHVPGVKRVHIFDHTIRRPEASDSRSSDNKRGPVERVHVDQTYEAGIRRVREHLPEDAERLLKHRVRIINVWRPIANPVAHHPLAVADWRTINPSTELVPTSLITPTRVGETFSVKYNPEHTWYYLGNQTPEEVTLIKCFDSEEGDVAKLTPHTAFTDEGSDKAAPQRQSIEVRCLVFDSE